MALLNYTTSIDAWQTVSEIQQLLARAGATHFSIRNEGSSPMGICFTIDFNGRPLNYSLPCKVEAIKKHLQTDPVAKARITKQGKGKDIHGHSLNVGWRIVKDWIEAQTALIQVEMTTIAEVFMPFLIINDAGETLSNRVLFGDGLKKLGY